MGMAVALANMDMAMAVRLAGRIGGCVIMTVVDVMPMTMDMGQQRMAVRMAVALGQVGP